MAALEGGDPARWPLRGLRHERVCVSVPPDLGPSAEPQRAFPFMYFWFCARV